MRASDHTTLQQVLLRDQAVRILHRAITHALLHEEAAALAALHGPRAREWYEDVDELAGLGCVFTAEKVPA